MHTADVGRLERLVVVVEVRRDPEQRVERERSAGDDAGHLHPLLHVGAYDFGHRASSLAYFLRLKSEPQKPLGLSPLFPSIWTDGSSSLCPARCGIVWVGVSATI